MPGAGDDDASPDELLPAVAPPPVLGLCFVKSSVDLPPPPPPDAVDDANGWHIGCSFPTDPQSCKSESFVFCGTIAVIGNVAGLPFGPCCTCTFIVIFFVALDPVAAVVLVLVLLIALLIKNFNPPAPADDDVAGADDGCCCCCALAYCVDIDMIAPAE